VAKISFLFILLLSSSASAEYRLFLLEFKNEANELVRTEKSTLDPDQYRGYYNVPPTLSVTYTQTWMCFGNTSHQDYCKSPQELANEKTETQDPAAVENPDQK